MGEEEPDLGPGSPTEPLEFSSLEVLSYLFHLSDEMAAMAGARGFSKVAAALELARALCAEELASAAPQSGTGKAAPEEAA